MPIVEDAEDDVIFSLIAIGVLIWLGYMLIKVWIPELLNAGNTATGKVVDKIAGTNSPAPDVTGTTVWQSIWDDIGL